MRQVCGIVLAATGSLLLAAAHLSGGEKLPQLAVGRLDVAVYDGIPVNRRDSAAKQVVEVARKDGHLFLCLDLSVSVTWNQESNRSLFVNAKEVSLTAPDGKSYPSVGKLSDGVLSQKAYFRCSRPYGWKQSDKPQSVAHSAVFIVPAELKAGQFKLGHLGPMKVTVPGTVVKPLAPAFPKPRSPASDLTVTILDATLLDGVEGKAKLGKEELATTVTSLRGKLLAIKLSLQPLRCNSQTSKTLFYWRTSAFGLRYGKDGYVPCIGEAFMGEVNGEVNHNVHSEGGKWKSIEGTYYFAPAAEIGDFEVTYKVTPVAGGKVGGPYKTIEVK